MASASHVVALRMIFDKKFGQNIKVPIGIKNRVFKTNEKSETYLKNMLGISINDITKIFICFDYIIDKYISSTPQKKFSEEIVALNKNNIEIERTLNTTKRLLLNNITDNAKILELNAKM